MVPQEWQVLSSKGVSDPLPMLRPEQLRTVRPSLHPHLTSISQPAFACLCQLVCLSVPGSYTSPLCDCPIMAPCLPGLCTTPQNTSDMEAGQRGRGSPELCIEASV